MLARFRHGHIGYPAMDKSSQLAHWISANNLWEWLGIHDIDLGCAAAACKIRAATIEVLKASAYLTATLRLRRLCSAEIPSLALRFAPVHRIIIASSHG